MSSVALKDVSALARLMPDKWGEWFGKSLRETCGVTNRRIVFHSLRHTFKDCARDSGIAEGIQRQLMGHEGKDVADSYGAGFSRRTLVEAVRTYRVAGLPDLSAPSVGAKELL